MFVVWVDYVDLVITHWVNAALPAIHRKIDDQCAYESYSNQGQPFPRAQHDADYFTDRDSRDSLAGVAMIAGIAGIATPC